MNGSITTSLVQRETASGTPAYRVPAGGGVITAWTIRGGNDAPGSARLKVARLVPGAFLRYLVVSQSEFVPVPTNALVTVTDQHVAAAPGDVIGMTGNGKVPLFTGASLPGDLYD